LANYLLARVRLEADHNGPLPLRVLRWKPKGKGPEDGFGDDSAAFNDVRQIVTLGSRLPAPRHWLTVTVQLFAEYSVQPVSEVSEVWKDSVVERHWIGLDRVLRLPLDADTLAARLAARQAAAA